jgi:hypothetical protein
MADEIPYPKAPQYTPPNPLQQMEQMQGIALRGAEAQRVQQANEQQALVNRAQMGLGQLMQQHVNPETGDVDINKLLVDAAQHPEVAVLFPAITKDALANKLTSAQILGAQIDNATKKQSFLANTAASYADKYAKTGAKAGWSDIASIYAEAQAAGVLSREDAMKGLVFAKQSGQQPEALIRNLGARSAQGLQMLEAAGQTTKYLQELVSTVSPEGTPMQITREQALQQAGAAPSPNAAGGTLAPRPGPAAREEGLPSAPPPAPMRGIPTGQSPQKIKYQEQQLTQFNDAEKQIGANARGAVVVQQRLDEAVDALKDFKTGPGTETMSKLASLAKFFGRDDLASTMLGNPGSKDAFASAQEFVKLMVPNSLELLRNTLGGQGRITNLEVEQFLKANPNLETDPKAIEKMFNFMKRVGDLAKAEQKAFLHYKKRAEKTGEFDVTQFDDDWYDYLREKGELKSGSYKIQQPGAK